MRSFYSYNHIKSNIYNIIGTVPKVLYIMLYYIHIGYTFLLYNTYAY
jgi:hypothetical protein